MKETVITNIEIEDSDYELLRKWYPEDPCTKCNDRYSCCGCSTKRKVDEAIKPLKDANLLEIQHKVQKTKELQLELRGIEKIIADNKEYLRNKGFDLDRIFGDDGNTEIRKSGAFTAN